jgi:hypothetical protein
VTAPQADAIIRDGSMGRLVHDAIKVNASDLLTKRIETSELPLYQLLFNEDEIEQDAKKHG